MEIPSPPSSRFLTLADGDPRLDELLEGRSTDNSTRALLLPSNHEWTFEFVSRTAIKRPPILIVWMIALRPDTLVLSIAPIIATLGWLLAWAEAVNREISIWHAALTIAGILALHAAVNLFNDYHDHKRGWDRVEGRGGSRVIGRGWLRALDVRRAAWAAFSVAVLAAVPVMIANFSAGILLGLFVLTAALEFAISRFGLKYRGFAEIMAWFMFGPLLTGGFTWAMTGQLIVRSFALGGVFGSLALLCLHLKNFERILIDGRAGLRTWPVRAGFDASKTFTYFCLGLISASMAFVLVFVDPVPERVIPALVLAFGVGPLALRVRGIESPVAGRMRGLHAAGLRLAWMNLIAFALGDLLRHLPIGLALSLRP